ncbi:PEP-CTERM sorting domain-containing protein [Roseibacillus ishigakijimensis]|uniref:PEP-CTERM sorting domain-containing protein n=1 Tax=Roseibacillus ishigakijimensis TaxID=454146 RepID=A0A934RVK2_9BACT|nr:PEP-CTERM sorting domain-containing protein [Roseibacillus ishigakijimensis]MBK1834960.1 PEP-CTERM sorting domain-containing protein [Roseibacillus ishigakijimensis]
MSPLRGKRSLSRFLPTLITPFAMSPVMAQTNWTGTNSSDPTDAGNWSAGVPVPADDGTNTTMFVTDTSVNQPTIASDISSDWDIVVGNDSGFTSVLNQTAGTLATGNNNWMFVGQNGGAGTYNLNGSGNLSAGKLHISSWGGGGGTGEVNVNTSGTLTTYSDAAFSNATLSNPSIMVGENNGNGTLNLLNGTIDASSKVTFGASGNSTGNLNISGGNFDIETELWLGHFGGGNAIQNGGSISTGGWFVLGRNSGSNGNFTLNEGTVNAATGNGHATVGAIGTAQGSLTINGGTFNTGTPGSHAADLIIGESGTGSLTMTGGNANISGGLRIAAAGGSTGTVNLDGGVLAITDGTIETGGTGTLNFNGGTLSLTDTGGALSKIGTGNLTVTGTAGGTSGAISSFTVAAGGLYLADNLETTSLTIAADAILGAADSAAEISGNLHFDSGGLLDLTNGILTLASGSSLTFGGFSLSDILGDDPLTAMAGTYTLIEGDFLLDSTNLENFGEENAFLREDGMKVWFHEGSLGYTVAPIPEPSTLLLGGMSLLALLGWRKR